MATSPSEAFDFFDCSQWGTHPHEWEPEHVADGWLLMNLRAQNIPESVFVPICGECARGFEGDRRATLWLFRNRR